jgi:hypothetical protein
MRVQERHFPDRGKIFNSPKNFGTKLAVPVLILMPATTTSWRMTGQNPKNRSNFDEDSEDPRSVPSIACLAQTYLQLLLIKLFVI